MEQLMQMGSKEYSEMIQEAHSQGEQKTYDYYQQAEEGMERSRV